MLTNFNCLTKQHIDYFPIVYPDDAATSLAEKRYSDVDLLRLLGVVHLSHIVEREGGLGKYIVKSERSLQVESERKRAKASANASERTPQRAKRRPYKRRRSQASERFLRSTTVDRICASFLLVYTSVRLGERG